MPENENISESASENSSENTAKNSSGNSRQKPSGNSSQNRSEHPSQAPDRPDMSGIPDSPDLLYYQKLADRWKSGKITPAELALLEAWYGKDIDGKAAVDDPLEIPGSVAESAAAHERRLLEKIHQQIHLKIQDAGLDKLDKLDNEKSERLQKHPYDIGDHMQEMSQAAPETPKGSVLGRIAVFAGTTTPFVKAAAVILLALVIGTLYRYYNNPSLDHVATSPIADAAISDIAPGHSGAVLKLDDGSTILLDSLQENVVLKKGDVEITKRNGALAYVGKSSRPLFNEIVTQRGRQWKMILPDGTKVWLNAASSLRYPVSFTGQGKQRVVELKGEAYFEVVHDARKPFQVKTKGALIEDLGTSFNVSAYEDDSSVKTTLVEGIVKVGGVRLKPGEQASSRTEPGQGADPEKETHMVTVSTVDVTGVTAWVNGQLSMDNKSVKELMRQLSRWYDVDIVYEGAVPDKKLGGIIDRNAYLSDIVHALSAYGIRLKLESENRKIIVSPN